MTNSIYCDHCEDGKIQDPENLDYDLQGDPAEYVYRGSYIDCPVCKGTGLSNQGESQEHIGVQAIPGLTSTPPDASWVDGATEATSGTLDSTRGAEAVKLLSSQVTRYAILTAKGYVAGIFDATTSYCSDSAYALTWPTMTEALLEMLNRGMNGEVETVTR